MEILYESAFVRVLDVGTHYILEDFTLMKYRDIGKRTIDIGDGEVIVAECVETDEGKIAVKRWHLPKSLPRSLIIDRAKNITRRYNRIARRGIV